MSVVSEPRTRGLDEARLDLVRQRIDEHVGSGRSPSVAAVVSHRGETVFAESRGLGDPAGAPLTLDHLWPIASAGKPMVAATILTLVEEGCVGITERVVDHIPELAEVGPEESTILVHHLLTHTTGWESPLFTGRREEVIASGEAGDPPPGIDPITHLDLWLAFNSKRVAPVGRQMIYSNVHYALLCEIIRRVTGTSLQEAMQERLFAPAGMHRSAVQVTGGLVGDLVVRPDHLPFAVDDGEGRSSLQSPEQRASDDGAGGVHCSPGDIVRFGEMLRCGGTSADGHRVLSPAAVRAMTTNQVPGVPAVFPDQDRDEAWYGYGFIIVSTERYPYFGGGLVPPGSVNHPGAGGISFWIDFDHELVCAFFEVITELDDETLQPVSGFGHRFQDMITAAASAGG